MFTTPRSKHSQLRRTQPQATTAQQTQQHYSTPLKDNNNNKNSLLQSALLNNSKAFLQQETPLAAHSTLHSSLSHARPPRSSLFRNSLRLSEIRDDHNVSLGSSMNLGSSTFSTISHLDAADVLDLRNNAEQSTSENMDAALGRDRNVLAKDDLHAVTLLGGVPSEVEDILRSCDRSQINATFDVASNYVAVATRKSCYVWQYQKKASAATATYFRFDMPGANEDENTPLPIVAIVTLGDRREPGLFLCSRTGECRYWEQISNAVTGMERCMTMQVYIGAAGDSVFDLVNYDKAGFIMATNFGLLFRIALYNANGQSSLSYITLSRPRNILSRFTSILGGSGMSEVDVAGNERVVALVNGDVNDARHSREIFLVTSNSLQKWVVSRSYPEKFLFEREILEDISFRIQADTGSDKIEDNHIKIHHADYTRNGKLAILVSFIATTSPSEEPKRKHGIILTEPAQSELNILGAVYPSFSNLSKDIPTTNPQLSLSNGGPVAFITLLDTNTVICVTLVVGTGFEEARAFKDQLIGSGVDRSRIKSYAREPESTSEIAMLCANSGIINMEVNTSLITDNASDIDRSHLMAVDVQSEDIRKTEALKAKLEQAVFFGGSEANPLKFSLSDVDSGDLNKAAGALSDEILTSQSKHMPPIMELRLHLVERLNRLNHLISFINSNGAIGRLSLEARYLLCWNAEKMAAAVDLWIYRNAFLTSTTTQRSANITADPLFTAIESYFSYQGSALPHGVDTVREFFTHRLPSLGELVKMVREQFMLRLPNFDQANYQKYASLKEVNKIILVVVKKALLYRQTWMQRYGLDGTATTESWTATQDMVDVLALQYRSTADALKELRTEVDEIVQHQEFEMETSHNDILGNNQFRTMASSLRDQLCDLADVVYRSFTERLDMLDSASDPTTRNQYLQLQQNFESVRNMIVESLVSFGRSAVAFELSERHGDHEALVELSLPLPNRDEKIRYYSSTYGSAFSDVLYEYYVRNDEVRKLIDQPDEFSGTLADYLARRETVVNSSKDDAVSAGREVPIDSNDSASVSATDLAEIAWIHDVRETRDLGKAVERMRRVVDRESKTEHKELALSLLKIFEFANPTADAEVKDQNAKQLEHIQVTVDAFHALGVGIEERLRKLDLSPEQLSLALVPELSEYPALGEYAVRIADAILKDDYLEIEDLCDSITFFDDGRVLPAPVYLYRYKFYGTLNQGRHDSLLRSCWRRIFIHDPWPVLLDGRKTWSDERFVNELKRTKTYRSIARTLRFEGISRSYILPPANVYDHSTREDLVSRFGTYPDPQLNRLLLDLKAENRQLDGLLMNFGLKEFFTECMRLASSEERESEVEEGEGEEKEMMDTSPLR